MSENKSGPAFVSGDIRFHPELVGLTKKQMLDIMRLISALESWAMSDRNTCLPDYLTEDINRSVEILEKGILE